jgi:hypothetical protein
MPHRLLARWAEIDGFGAEFEKRSGAGLAPFWPPVLAAVIAGADGAANWHGMPHMFDRNPLIRNQGIYDLSSQMPM